MRAQSPIGRAVWGRDAARTVIALQILAIFAAGAVTVTRFHIFAPIDERAHLAYVQEVAEHGRIPRLSSHVPWQELAIEAHTYPQHSSLDPELIGLRGISYEAWQPPLYYTLAASAFLMPANYRDKILAVRAFDLLLLLAAVGILALLARAVCGEHWRVPYCLALSTILWPGIIVRTITISNAALELPLVLLYVLAVWSATVRARGRSVIAAGGLLGLCALTQLTLVCLAPLLAFPIAALLREHRDRRAVGMIAMTLALPLILLAPWVVSNESRYGTLAASSQVERLTGSYESTTGRSGLTAVTSRLWRFGQAALPQEWWPEYRGLLGVLLVAVPVLLLLTALVAALRNPGLMRSRAAGLLGSPLLLALATLSAIVLLDEWPAAVFPRYTNPMIPLFALFGAWAWIQARMGTRSLLALGTASSGVAALAWVYVAGAYYFTHIGASLGIHAAPPG